MIRGFLRLPSFSTILRHEHGQTIGGIIQIVVVLGLLVGLFLMGSEIKKNANTIMVINRVREYDAATRNFVDTYAALPGDIGNPKLRIPNCTVMPCAAPGNNNRIVADRKPLLSTNYFYRDTSENRTYWLHLAVAGLISSVKTDGSTSKYFGQWGVEFPKAPISVQGGFHIAYYSVTSTPFSPVSLLGHYIVLRGSTDTYGITAAPYALSPVTAYAIDKKIDDGNAASGRVVAAGSANCTNKEGKYGEDSDARECNLLFQTSF